MLAWLLKCERPPPLILALCRPEGEMAVGQVAINLQIRDHLVGVYSPLADVEAHEVGDFLDMIVIPRLTEAQAEGLSENITLEEPSRIRPKTSVPGMDGLPAEYCQAYSASLSY